jgi:RimJ/RimL family protein N-acetyltransferase
MTAPVLTTERLVLRAPEMADFAPYAAFLSTERTKFMAGPLDARRAWGWFCNDVAQWPLLDMGALIMLRQGRPIGQVAICHGPHFPEPELGWFLFSASDEGQGYAFEAAAAFRDWAFGPRGMATLVSYIDPDNAPSRRLAERLGAWIDPAAATPDGEACLVYRHGGAE